ASAADVRADSLRANVIPAKAGIQGPRHCAWGSDTCSVVAVMVEVRPAVVVRDQQRDQRRIVGLLLRAGVQRADLHHVGVGLGRGGAAGGAAVEDRRGAGGDDDLVGAGGDLGGGGAGAGGGGGHGRGAADAGADRDQVDAQAGGGALRGVV